MQPGRSPLDLHANRNAVSTNATVMFADIVGFTRMSEAMGAERAYLVVTGALRILDGIIRKHGGSVDKYLGDCLMAVFGYPVPLERAEQAAAAAAIEMRAQVREYNRELGLDIPLDLVIGVNGGPMVGGDISGPVIREFHVLGDAVNVAARMKARAPVGAIYVGATVHAATCDVYEYRTLEPMQFKGKSKRIPTYEIVDVATTRAGGALGDGQTRYCDLVGRQDELGRLRDLARRLRTGPAGPLVLLGAAGLGKTRLLAELAADPALDGVAVLHVTTTAALRDRPLEPAVDLLRQATGLGPPGTEPAGTATDPTALAAALAGAVRRAAAHSPVLIAVDGVEGADPELLRILATACAEMAPARVGVLLAGRPEVRDLLHATFGEVEDVPLEPLGETDQRRLVDCLAGEQGLDETARVRVLAGAAGNPAQIVRGVFVAPALRSEDASQRSRDAERRRATILFADISGFTAMTEQLGAERAYPVVAGCLALLDRLARKHGGTVEKYLGDCVMALFGVPEAIEDAPRAAINAAIEMRSAVAEYNDEHGLERRLDVHSGINTGLGIAGDVSGPMIREFAVMGEPVSIADRLKDLAPEGEIYVGAEVEKATRDVFEFAPLDPVPLKGSNTQVRAFELRSRDMRLYRARLGSERQVFSTLVGRETEVAQLREALDRVRRGTGAIVSIIAEAGLGKSRLVAELQAQASGFRWLEGRSLSTGRQRSFHPFADLFRSWIDAAEDDGDEETRRKLRALLERRLPGEANALFPFVCSLLALRLEPAERERLERAQGESLVRRFRHGVLDLLRREAAEQPVIVVMDDLHWADQSSIELLEGLLSLVVERPLLFLNVSRAGAPTTSQRILELVRQQHGAVHTELRLEPLDARASRQLIANLFKGGDVPFETRQLIETRAQGNPFYIEEVVRSLLDAGAIELREGRFLATERIADVDIPGTVQEVVMARVDRLEPGRRQLLQLASVIGGNFHRDVLAEVISATELDEHLAALRDAEFIVPSERLPGIEYAFKHPLIQEVTYEGLLVARRQELHREVASAMKVRMPPDTPGLQGMLAYHFSRGRDVERAEEHLFRAGDEAALAAGTGEALYFFREASKLYLDLHGDGGDPVKKARLQRSIARALYYRGQLVEAVEAYNQALEFLGERVPRSQRALVLRLLRDMTGSLLRVYWHRQRPLASATDRQAVDLLFERTLSEVTGSSKRFLFDSMAMLAKLSQVAPESIPGSGGMYAAGSVVFSYGGISFAVARRLLAIASGAVNEQDPGEYTLYRMMSHAHHYFEGDWDHAHLIPEPLLYEGLRNGKTWEVLSHMVLRGEHFATTGEWAECRKWIAFNDTMWERYQNDLARSQHSYLTAYLLLEQGHLPESLQAATEYHENNPEVLLHVTAFGLKAKIHCLMGDLDEAERDLARAANIIRQEGALTVPLFQRTHYLRSRLLVDAIRFEHAVRAGDRRQGRRLAARARRSVRRATRAAVWLASRQPEVYRLAGRVEWLAGRRRRALAWWERSLVAANRIGARPERARIAVELAERLRDPHAPLREIAGRDAAAWLAEGRAILAELALGEEAARAGAPASEDPRAESLPDSPFSH